MKFRSAGASIVALCPQLPKHNAQIAKQLGIQFPILQDPSNSLATQFGITIPTPPEVVKAEMALGLDLENHNGHSNWDLPMPSRFAIDRKMMIRYASVNADHRKRSDPAECLMVLLDQN